MRTLLGGCSLVDKEVCDVLQVNYSATLLKSEFNLRILILNSYQMAENSRQID
jgi:hypothetical protein